MALALLLRAGTCAPSCSTTAQGCVDSTCVCNAAHPDTCNGACVNKQNDPTNCGTCGHTCNANQNCIAGTCR